ncbi:type II secretion system F family protein [Marilutibacter chinensis]|uniref:Type II secretion system F family protein n=1 Tax=Marilutibacter chinensis TaxID=2912247 RepID=A0ABS9HZH2_9GAMM|nr:type II secretion system F family protein [Lysobacter chinensis]MCF7223595.1 type II secretion system F family protein [Lysobacter chinensis]
MMLIILPLMVGAAIVLALLAIRGILQSAPKTEREYQDPLPAMLRMIWPLVTIATHVVGPRMSSETMEKSHRALQSAGQDYLVSPEELVGLRVVGAGIATAILFALMMMLKPGFGSLMMAVAIGVPIGWLYPTLWLSERRKVRVKKVIRDLPIFLDFITMSVEAGLNITGAIEQAVQKGPAGPLGQEFSRMLRDLRAGLPRSEALRRLADRMDIAQISSFTSALIQADRVGASLGDTLRAQSMQRREERFLLAEKLAMEAPVKMMFPLVTCFFPLIFLVLAYFIYLKMVQDGIL